MNSSRFFSPCLVLITVIFLFSGMKAGAQDSGESYTNQINSSVNINGTNGINYNWVTGTETYTWDYNSLTYYRSSWTETYFGNGYSFTASGPNGSISGSESGYVVGGTMYIDSSSSSNWGIGENTSGSHGLFGSTYYLTSSYSSTTYRSDGTPYSSSGTRYESDSGGSYWVRSGELTSGNDPYVGSWSLQGGSFDYLPVFAGRSSPRFVPSNELVLWVNGTAVNWQGSTINDTAGSLTEVWEGGGIVVTVTGNARSFVVSDDVASITVKENGTQIATGQITQASGFSGFPQGFAIQFANPAQTTPFFTGTTDLYVDNVLFEFLEGYELASGSRTDVYQHSSGTITLVGTTTAPGVADVSVSVDGVLHQGAFAEGVFTMQEPSPPAQACEVRMQALVFAEAFWVDGLLYQMQGYDNVSTYTYSTGGSAPQALTLSGADASSLTISGTHPSGAVNGTFDSTIGGVFNVTIGSASRIACASSHYGYPQSGGTLPENMPPAVKAGDDLYQFVGMAADETAPASPIACYGAYVYRPNSAGNYIPHLGLLTIRATPEVSTTLHAVGVRVYGADSLRTGSYDPATSLFYTKAPAVGASTSLPPTHRTVPSAHTRWLNSPPAGLPYSFLVRGQPWWYAGGVGGAASYHGFYYGQVMTLGAPQGANQERLVTLIDRAKNGLDADGNDIITRGMLSDVRRSVRLRDGTVVFSGMEDGSQQVVAINEVNQLHTISADLDILGNSLSFGVLKQDASLAGAAWRFEDRNTIAVLHNMLSRPQAEWIWWKAGSSQAQDLSPVMQIDTNNRLSLFSPGSAQATIILNPAEDGVSSIRGKLRVRPGGDIDMGEFTSGPQP